MYLYTATTSRTCWRGRAQSLSGPNCSSDATSAICRCIVVVVVVVPLRATPTPQPAAAAAAAEAQRKLASLCYKSFSSSTTSRGAPTKMWPRFTKEQQQQWKKKKLKKKDTMKCILQIHTL